MTVSVKNDFDRLFTTSAREYNLRVRMPQLFWSSQNTENGVKVDSTLKLPTNTLQFVRHMYLRQDYTDKPGGTRLRMWEDDKNVCANHQFLVTDTLGTEKVLFYKYVPTQMVEVVTPESWHYNLVGDKATPDNRDVHKFNIVHELCLYGHTSDLDLTCNISKSLFNKLFDICKDKPFLAEHAFTTFGSPNKALSKKFGRSPVAVIYTASGGGGVESIVKHEKSICKHIGPDGLLSMVIVTPHGWFNFTQQLHTKSLMVNFISGTAEGPNGALLFLRYDGLLIKSVEDLLAILKTMGIWI